jgi:hypothetical protein
MAEYSAVIYPIFVWYAYAARMDKPGLFTLTDFRNTVKINFVNVEDGGKSTLEWLGRNVERRIQTLENHHPEVLPEIRKFEQTLQQRGVLPAETYLYMQGHTLYENVVLTLVSTVANSLRKRGIAQIMGSSRKGLPLNNELSYYNNSITDVDELLRTNMGFRSCPLFAKLHDDMTRMLDKNS